MTGKQFLILSLIVTVAFTQTSLTDVILKSRSMTTIGRDADAFAPDDSYVPCGSRDSCGQAKSFENKEEFQNFLDQSLPPIAQRAQIAAQVQPRIEAKMQIQNQN